MKLNRARYVRHFAEILPWWLGFLSVWMLDYERRRIEKMLARMCEAITDFAKLAVHEPRVSALDAAAFSAYSSLLGVGGIFSGLNAARSAQYQAMAAQQQMNAVAAQIYASMGQAANPYGNGLGQLGKSHDFFNTIYRKESWLKSSLVGTYSGAKPPRN